MSEQKTALVLGSTGLVGQQLVLQLLRDPRYIKVTCLVRQPIPAGSYPDPAGKLHDVTVDFDQLQQWQTEFAVDHVYVCLGTTIKQAGSQRAFRQVDYDYVLKAAELSRGQNVQSFVWISSVGASSRSGNFYLRVKGELEDRLLNMQGLRSASPVRPSLLLGERQQRRPLEQLGILFAGVVSPLMRGPLQKYRPIHAIQVARQMIERQDFT